MREAVHTEFSHPCRPKAGSRCSCCSCCSLSMVFLPIPLVAFVAAEKAAETSAPVATTTLGDVRGTLLGMNAASIRLGLDSP